eukprot:scaffold20189_cov79-Isochrysis_galbana.AAC.1
MLSWRGGPDAVFSSLLASCFDDTGPTEDDARKLAALEERKGQAGVNGAAGAAPGGGAHAGTSSDDEDSSGADTGGGGDGGAIAELRRRAIAAAQMAVDSFQ